MRMSECVFSVELLMISEKGVPVLVEDGWRDYIDVKIRFLSFCMRTVLFYLPSCFPGLGVLTFSNYPLLWVVLVVSRAAHGDP